MQRLLCFVLGCGLASCAASEPSAELATPTSIESTTLGAGDVFEVRVYQEPDLSGPYRVASDGSIAFPLLGRVEVAGRSSNEVGVALTEGLRAGFLKNPHVTVLVREYTSKKVFVLGQVSRPGAIPYTDELSMVGAIAAAGGLAKNAAANRTTVTRVVDGKEQRSTIRVDDIGAGKERNVMLAPGDIVYVPESIF